MFNKLKNRLGEEINQVKQLVQVMSPTASVNSLSELKGSSDAVPAVLSAATAVSPMMFSISDDADNSSTFDLTANSPSIMPTRSRRDSLSSVASDASSLYPIFEGSFSHNQSDWESELDESSVSQLESINKAQLYCGYKKLMAKYQKYKMRCLEQSRIYLDLQRENSKMKSVFQESQDKSLRRNEELREQCQLEQKAKAHLEDSLRNDLEERDHLIKTLQTKISLLKSGAPVQDNDNVLFEDIIDQQVSGLNKSTENVSHGGSAEHVKETITQLKSGLVRMKSDNENISNLLSKSPTIADCLENGPLIDLSEADEKEKNEENCVLCNERISTLTTDINEEKSKVLELSTQLDVMMLKMDEAQNTIDCLNADYAKLRTREEKLAYENSQNQELIQKIEIELKESQSVEMEVKSTAKSKLAQYEATIMELKEAVSQATAIRDDALKKLESDGLVKDLAKAAKISRKIDFDREKEKIDLMAKVFFEAQQSKLAYVLTKVEEKLIKAEGNIARICADKLINDRSTELELRAKISELEQQRDNAAINEVKMGNLEEQLKHLETRSQEKDAIIDEKTKMVSDLNTELNEKIDRIVLLGQELEESKANHQLLIESTDSKNQFFAKAKSDYEDKYSKLEERVQQLKTQIQKVVEENLVYKTKNQEICANAEILESALDACKKEVVGLRDEKRDLESQFSALKAEISEFEVSLHEKSVLSKTMENRALEAEKRLQESIDNSTTVTANIEKIISEKNELLDCKKNMEIAMQENCSLLELGQQQIKELEQTIKNSEVQSNQMRCEIAQLKTELEESGEKLKTIHENSSELEDIRNELESKQEMENKLKSIIEERETSLKNVSKELIMFRDEMEAEKTKIREECDSKLNILKNEIKFLNEKFEQDVGNVESNSEREISELREKLAHSENMADELLKKLEDGSTQREELTQRCEDKTLEISELQSCLTELKSNLDRNFNQNPQITSTDFEENYEMKLKEIVTEFEKQVAEKEDRNRELETQLCENTDLVQSLPALRVELKNLRAALKEKDDLLETKMEELENLRKESDNRILNAKIDGDDLLLAEKEKYKQQLLQQKIEFQELMEREKDSSLKVIDEEKHSVQLINDTKLMKLEGQLKKTWEEKKNDALDGSNENTAEINEDLESTSKIAVAAVASSTESLELLRKELMSQSEEIKEMKKQHKREVIELRKLAMIRAQSLNRRDGEDVEHEYLRNILYEYMMGREQLVLAKVLAAIVKFDRQQTSNILERQQSVSSLRIL